MMRYKPLLTSTALLVVLFVAGCDLGVTNPGVIGEEDLNTRAGVDPLATGMSAALSLALDDIIFTSARMSDELAGSGSFLLTSQVRRGRIRPEDVNGYWNDIQRARFTAEDGLERMQTVLGEDFEGDPRAARAYFFAGISNRILGENFCRVVFDGGEAQPPNAAFQRAVEHFTQAIEHARAAGTEDVLRAAYGGRAQAYLNLGMLAEAVEDAQEVPTDFSYDAVYDAEADQNEVFNQTHDRYEMSAYASLAGGHSSLELPSDSLPVVPESERDPRAPYTDCRTSEDCFSVLGTDGVTPHLRQGKYAELGADIPLVKGTDMRLIEAEAALENGNLELALSNINAARAHYGLNPVPADSINRLGQKGPDGFEEGTGWGLLDRERHLTLWLEGRRLNDLRRWNHPYIYGGTVAYPVDVEQRAVCIPVAFSECNTNDQVECQIPYVE